MQHPSGREVHRAGAGRVLAAVWWVVATVLLVDLGLRGTWPSAGVAACIVLLLALLAHAFWWHPAVEVDDEAVTLRNPLRDVRVPWPAVVAIGGAWSLDVRTGSRSYPTYVAAARRRARPAEPGVAGPAQGTSLSQALSARWERCRDSAPAGEVQVRWRWEVLAVAALLLLALGAASAG